MPNPGHRWITTGHEETLMAALTATPMETSDVRRHIDVEYGILYSMKQLHVTLSEMGLRHAKPYSTDHKTR